MKNYEIQQLQDKKYNALLLWLSSESIIEYITEIEHEPLLMQSKGTLLIDQLLITGDGKNRFVSYLYDHGKIDLTTAKRVEQNNYKKISKELLRKNFELLKYSILTKKQLQEIKE